MEVREVAKTREVTATHESALVYSDMIARLQKCNGRLVDIIERLTGESPGKDVAALNVTELPTLDALRVCNDIALDEVNYMEDFLSRLENLV